MRVPAVRPFMLLLVVIALLYGSLMGSPAQEATPEPVDQSLRSNLPPEFCTPDEIANGKTDIIEEPADAAEVQPGSTPGRFLYLVVITLPPKTCLGYASHYLHDGAIVWYVQKGEIEFAAQRIGGLPAPRITAVNVSGTSIPISGAPTRLHEGDWVALDRPGEYSYRNPSDTADTVVLMAVNESDPFATSVIRGCKGGCKKG